MKHFSIRLASAILVLALIGAEVACAHGLDEPPYQSPASAGNAAVQTARPRQVPGQTLPLRPGRHIAFDTSEGTWMSLDISRDGRTLAFDLLGDVYVLDIGGGQAKQITRGLAFDAQPTFAPNGKLIAYVSDRSGAENIWVMRPDGSGARQISFGDDDTVLVSPAWSADGDSFFVSRYRPSFNGYELWRYGLDGSETLLAPIAAPGQADTAWSQSLGAAPSPDGRTLYLARHAGRIDFEKLQEWTIVRRDLATGAEETVVTEPDAPRKALNPGAAFRPAVSPDGKWLAYAARFDNQTGLRLRDVKTGEDRWLAFPIEHDQLMAAAWQDLVPRYAFTPDSKAIVLSRKGSFEKIDLAGGRATQIPFTAKVDLDLGPLTRPIVRNETGPVRARIIQTPEMSPDGRRLAFSALGGVYVMPLDKTGMPQRITAEGVPAFHPSWSPDGTELVYVTWTAKDAGRIWIVKADGSGPARKVDQDAARTFYTRPAFTPDGRMIAALRSAQQDRLHTYMEYGSLREAELVTLPVAGGAAHVVTAGMLGGKPHFTTGAPSETYVLSDQGLKAVTLENGVGRAVAALVGPGFYFQDGPVPVDDIKVSPDGKWLLALIVQQLHVIEMPPAGRGTVDLSNPNLRHRRITDVGADFFGWSADGRDIVWAVGSTFYRRPLSSVTFNAADAPSWTADAPAPGKGGVTAYPAVVQVPRDQPQGTAVLRGARAITMAGEKVIDNADIVVTDGKIAAIGARDSAPIPQGAEIVDVSGRTIVPGFIDSHDHIADVRRDVLDMESWGFRARLADGITTAFDPSTLTIDMMAYQDLLDAGLITGSRLASTGTALFSFNRFSSLEDVRRVLRRYRDHYRTFNIKEYRTGNRRVRQWIAQAAAELGMLPTAEGALSMKLDLSQVMDGFSGNEHALVGPLYHDVIQLMARSRTSYTTTLQITNGGFPGQDYFISRSEPHADTKLAHFMPHFAIDQMTLQREWRPLAEYVFPDVARGAALIQRAGGVVGMGAHGEMPGPGFHWELEAHVMGGMTPMEALRAGTMGSAEAIGRAAELGSLEAGKYADLVVLAEDPRGDVRRARAIVYVMKNGRLYDAATLNEVWPRKNVLSPPWFADETPSSR